MCARNKIASAPFHLPANLIPRFYRGGQRIADFRGLANVGSHESEDWVGSTTTTRASDEVGLSHLGDGMLLRDAVHDDPLGFLGASHLAALGPTPSLLVKLLDAGERLPVHCHPSRAFASQFLGSTFGKTEAWHVLHAEPGAHVYVGFRTSVSVSELASLVAEQRAGSLLELLNPIQVTRGDTIFIPGGVPHSIGHGVLIVEVQEPTDQSVILEWTGFSIDAPKVGHLQLGYDAALRAVDRTAWDRDRLSQLRAPEAAEPRSPLLPESARPYFWLERVRPQPHATLEASFALLVVTAGVGELEWDAGSTLAIASGDTVLVPHGAGEVRVTGAVELLRCLGPAFSHLRKECLA